jgi:autotransporter translocation and assembly factor TamB
MPPRSASRNRAIERLRLKTTATDLLANPEVMLDGKATVDRLPATVATAVAIEGDRIAVRNLTVTLGKSKVAGDVAMASGLLSGKLALTAPALQELEPLAGLPIAGGALRRHNARCRQGPAERAAFGQGPTDRLPASRSRPRASMPRRLTDDLFGAPCDQRGLSS